MADTIAFHGTKPLAATRYGRRRLCRGDPCGRPRRANAGRRFTETGRHKGVPYIRPNSAQPHIRVVPCTSAPRARGGNSHGTNARGSAATGGVCSMRGRCGWAGGEPGAQRQRSAGPAMGRFYPSQPDRAKTLSSEQVRRFNADGFVRPLDALTQDEVDSARAYFESLLLRMQAMEDGRNTYALDGYHLCCRGIWEMALHPKILDYVEDLLGPDLVCWSTHYFCKMGGDPKRVPWHQDATYWPVRPTMTVTVWLAIDDVDEANSPLRFAAGSHLLGAVEWRKAEGHIVLRQEVPGAERYGDPVDNLLKAGQVSIHTSTLIHGSEPNTSENRRCCGLALRYVPSSCGAVKGAEHVASTSAYRAGPKLRTRRLATKLHASPLTDSRRRPSRLCCLIHLKNIASAPCRCPRWSSPTARSSWSGRRSAARCRGRGTDPAQPVRATLAAARAGEDDGLIRSDALRPVRRTRPAP